MEFDKRKLRDRSLIFAVTALGFVIFLTFDLAFSYDYSLNGDIRNSGTVWNWMMFWTHLSNVGALVWITCALSAVLLKNEELERKVQSWIWKNLTFTFIIVTGIVFVVTAYFPTIYIFAFGEGVKNETESGLYDAMVIIGTTFKHVIIPGMFIYLAFTDVGYSEESKLNKFEKSMTLFMVPCFYLIYVMIFASCGLGNAPYPIVNFEFTPHLMDDGTYAIVELSAWKAMLYMALDISVGIFFVFISLVQFKLEEMKKAKEKSA